MDGFAGYKNAATRPSRTRSPSWTPSTSSRSPGPSSTRAANASSSTPLGHRGRAGDPLYRARRTLRTRTELLTTRQRARLDAVFAARGPPPVEVTWRIYQDIIAAYAHPDPARAGPC